MSFLLSRRILLGFLKRTSSSGFFSGFLSKQTVSAFCFWRKRSWRLSNIRPPSPSLYNGGEGGEREGRERGKGRERRRVTVLAPLLFYASLKYERGHTGMLPCELDGIGASVGDEGVKVGLHGVVVALGTHLTLPQGNAYTGHK